MSTAAGLTMLEAFHPRDHLETMLAAQGVAAHCAMMDNFRCAAAADTPPLLAIKFRANTVQLSRMFCLNLRELARLQSSPLPPRPGRPPASPAPADDAPLPGDPPPGSEAAPVKRPRVRAKAAPAKLADPVEEAPQPAADLVCSAPEDLVKLEDIPELPEDIETRPDGTPGNLTAYAPKVPVVTVIPREALIMVALATRPKPWRMVNVPKDQAPIEPGDVAADASPPVAPSPQPEHQTLRGPVDLRERIFTGDALARFAATRFDPDAPVEPRSFEHEDSLEELELISTGGDPSAEAEQAAMARNCRRRTNRQPTTEPGGWLPAGRACYSRAIARLAEW
jgi:hypothetical protein